MHSGQKHTSGGRPVRLFLILRSQMKSNGCIDPHPESDGDRIDEILHREYKRQRSHRIFTDLRHKKTVYNIIKRIYQHRNDHGESHGKIKGRTGLSVIKVSFIISSPILKYIS